MICKFRELVNEKLEEVHFQDMERGGYSGTCVFKLNDDMIDVDDALIAHEFQFETLSSEGFQGDDEVFD